MPAQILMDTRTTGSSEAYAAPAPDLAPVPVTRWSARLADAQCEHDFRVHRFPNDRRRAWQLMVLVAAAGVLNVLVELNAYAHGLSPLAVLVPPVASVCLPLLALVVVLHVQTPRMLEGLMVVCVTVGAVTRFIMLTLHPDLNAMWPTMMIAVVLVAYLYLPVRLTVSAVIAGVISIVGPIWWTMASGGALPADHLYRALVALMLSNALGFTAANGLHRSLRVQFAQSLVLQQLLSTDALTGIANRRRFDAVLEREWRRCERAGAPLSLLMIDVDHFKAYNDHWGHQQGDECLKLVARLLLNSAGRPGDLVARYGGEEFVCLLPEVGPAGARSVAMRLTAALARANIPHPHSPSSLWLTMSIGAATASDFAGGPGTLIALADKLLYAAKNSGRDQIAEGALAAGQRAARAA
jgi:diguanylate cyclase (GGDEF)-like protein